jgi:predicted nucleic acid-binding protein
MERRWFYRMTDRLYTVVTLVQAALHKGGAAAIALATELRAERLVLDFQDARRFAGHCGLKIAGGPP